MVEGPSRGRDTFFEAQCSQSLFLVERLPVTSKERFSTGRSTKVRVAVRILLTGRRSINNITNNNNRNSKWVEYRPKLLSNGTEGDFGTAMLVS